MKLILSGLCLVVVLLTNRWLGWHQGLDVLQANDVFSYMSIMQSAPALPSEPISFHHAQRFLAPYLIGLLARVSSIPDYSLCTGASVLYMGLVVGCMHRICLRLQLSLVGHGLCMGLLILNPYLLRYYLLVPGMLPDTVFILGLTLTLLGLVERWGILVVVGIGMAACGRQTALLLLPGVGLWLLRGEGWRQRWQLLGWATLLSLGIYQMTGAIARQFALPSHNVEHLTGILDWMASPAFSLGGLLEHSLRLLIPQLLAMAVFLGAALATAWKVPVEAWASWIMTLCISAQPLLAGPVITGQNASRLSALGLACGIVAIALLLRQRPAPPWERRFGWTVALGGCVFLASFHHLYTWVGPANASQFALLQLGTAAIAGYTVYPLLRPHRAPS